MKKKKTAGGTAGKKPRKKTRAIVKRQVLPVSTFASADMLIEKLAGKNVDVDKLEKLLDLKGKYEAEENRKLFQIRFSQMQAEMPVIKKRKPVKDNSGNIAYKYAPLEDIIDQIKSYVQKYGFSYRWSEGVMESTGTKRIFCHIMGHGHEEKSYVDLPIPPGNKLTNTTQNAGSGLSYGRRYSLMNALGIMLEGDDDDGRKAAEVIVESTAPKTKKEKSEIDKKLREQVEILNWDVRQTDEFIVGMLGGQFNHKNIDSAQKEALSKHLDKAITEMQMGEK